VAVGTVYFNLNLIADGHRVGMLYSAHPELTLQLALNSAAILKSDNDPASG
jgi:hypothetical protein